MSHPNPKLKTAIDELQLMALTLDLAWKREIVCRSGNAGFVAGVALRSLDDATKVLRAAVDEIARDMPPPSV